MLRKKTQKYFLTHVGKIISINNYIEVKYEGMPRNLSDGYDNAVLTSRNAFMFKNNKKTIEILYFSKNKEDAESMILPLQQAKKYNL
jgi:hypothetical protein